MRARTRPIPPSRAAALVVALAVAGVIAASALAGTIVGTARNDALRGTAGADRLYGRQGNDTLLGLAGSDSLNGGPGSDRLNGGPGKDRFVCGPGRDMVVAQVGESVARDCEVVRRSGVATPPAPPAPPPPPPPPPPAPPPAPPARAGFFGGFASTGGSINFVVAGDGRSLSQFKFGYEADCQPDGRLSGSVTYPGVIPVAADGTVNFEGSTADQTLTLKLTGSFDAAGTAATGRFQVHVVHVEDGTRYECDSGGADWSAKWQG